MKIKVICINHTKEGGNKPSLLYHYASANPVKYTSRPTVQIISNPRLSSCSVFSFLVLCYFYTFVKQSSFVMRRKETEKQIFFSPQNFRYRKFVLRATVLLPVSFAEADVILAHKKL